MLNRSPVLTDTCRDRWRWPRPAPADPPGACGAARVRAFRDWRLDCRAEPCALYTAVAGADGSEVLRLAVTAGEAPALAITTALPLFLPDGIALAIGERAGRGRCRGGPAAPGGCEATAPLDPALLAALRRERGRQRDLHAGGRGAVRLRLLAPRLLRGARRASNVTLVDGMRERLPVSRGLAVASRALGVSSDP